MIDDLDYEGIEFPVSKRDYRKIENKNNICINVFCCENYLVYPVHIPDQKFKNCICLLLITYEDKSHYVYIKDLTRFMCNRTKCRTKNTFADIVYKVNAPYLKKYQITYSLRFCL